MNPKLQIDPSLDPCPCLPALIWARGIAPPFAQPGLPPFLVELVARAAELQDDMWPADIKARVRNILRHGKYKPAGRGKPASEFLLKAAAKGDFPAVCTAVDVNNAISLESGLPGTIFDSRLSGESLLLRRGLPEESYVFNRTGQSIDLQDLLLLCREVDGGWQACGNPVKDAMATKIQEDTEAVVAVLYAPRDMEQEQVTRWARRYADLLGEHCQAREVGCEVIVPRDGQS